MSIVMPGFLLLMLLVLPVLFRRLQINRLGYWLLGGYAVLLLVGLVVYSFIPDDESVDQEKLAFDNINLLHEMMNQVNSLEEFEEYKSMEWEYDVSGEEKVHLRMDTGHHYYIPAIIKRVEGQEGVHLSLYEAEPPIGLEVEEEYTAYFTMQYSAGTISILPNGHRWYRYAQVTKGFPFSLFEQEMHYPYHMDVFSHQNLLYVTIPEDVELSLSPEIEAHWLN